MFPELWLGLRQQRVPGLTNIVITYDGLYVNRASITVDFEKDQTLILKREIAAMSLIADPHGL